MLYVGGPGSIFPAGASPLIFLYLEYERASFQNTQSKGFGIDLRF